MKKYASLCTIIFTAMMASVFLYSACTHRVEVVGDRDKPIPIEAEIRIHIYQHAAQNVDKMMDALDDLDDELPDTSQRLNRFLYALANALGPRAAYAAQAPEQSLLQATIDAYREAAPYLSNGLLGENRNGYLSVIDKAQNVTDEQRQNAARAAEQVNTARRALYQNDARTQRVSIREIQAAYARAFQERARAGWWVEFNVDGEWQWMQK